PVEWVCRDAASGVPTLFCDLFAVGLRWPNGAVVQCAWRSPDMIVLSYRRIRQVDRNAMAAIQTSALGCAVVMPLRINASRRAGAEMSKASWHINLLGGLQAQCGDRIV